MVLQENMEKYGDFYYVFDVFHVCLLDGRLLKLKIRCFFFWRVLFAEADLSKVEAL